MKKYIFFCLVLMFGLNAFSQAGTRDTSFLKTNASTGLFHLIYPRMGIGLLNDGRILTGATTPGIVLTDLSNNIMDNSLPYPIFHTFSSGFRYVRDFAVLDDGRYYAFGRFDYVTRNIDGQNLVKLARGIVRFMPDGTFDQSYMTGNGTDYNSDILAIYVESDGSQVLAGGFYGDQSDASIDDPLPVFGGIFIKLDSNGNLVPNFGTGPGQFDEILNGSIDAIGRFSDGQYVVGGNFTGIIWPSQNIPNRLMRYTADGQMDLNWNTGSGFNNRVRTVHVLPNDQIIVTGDFTSFNGTPVNRIVRLNPDASLDTTFQIGSGFNQRTSASVMQDDGKIIIAGHFTTYDGFFTPSMVRLNPNGERDTSFYVGTKGFHSPTPNLVRRVTKLLIQPDGKLLAAGYFSMYGDNSDLNLGLTRILTCSTAYAEHTISACNSYTWIDGNTYTESNNTAIHKIMNPSGCDSVFTLNLTIYQESETPTAINSSNNFCLGGTAVLEVNGGSLTEGAQWEWFSGSCNATPIGTGSTLEVSPNANTTYYARASQGTACPASDCASVVVNMPATSTNLSVDGEHATCFVNQNGWVHFYNNAGNLIASIKSNGQDLGNVQVTSHIANSPYQSTSCTEENNASFFQTNLQRTFVITPENQPTDPVQVRLYVLDNEISAYQTAAMATTQNPHDDITTISDLHMTKVSGGTGSGDPADFCGSNATAEFLLQDASGNINDAETGLSGFTATSYLEFTIDAFSEFFPMNANNSALPVSLTHFSANCLGEKIGIQWTTASEFNASHYIIQSSRDGFVWQDLARISAVGTTNQISNYSYEDKNVGALTYYRLVQIDNDGEQEIFGPISSNCTLEYNLMTVYPNPTSDNFTVLIQTAEVFENAHIELVDLYGRVVLSQSTEIQSGSTMLNFDVQNMQPGAYLVRVKGENDSFAPIRVVKM